MPFLESFAWQLTQLSLHHGNPFLVVTAHNQELARTHELIQFFAPQLSILEFPDWETLPYDRLSAPTEMITKRLLTLSKINRLSKNTIILTTIPAILQRIAPSHYIASHIFRFSKQDQFDRTGLELQLIHSGYQRVSQVRIEGEFAIRGSIIDIFPLGSHLPLRLDMDMDDIDNLCYFDPITQQPQAACETIELLPKREFPLSQEGLMCFQKNWAQEFDQRFLKSTLYEQLSANSYPPGIEYYLPLFFEETATLLDYLPSSTQWAGTLSLLPALENFWRQLEVRYEELNADTQRPLLIPTRLYQTSDTLLQRLNKFEKAPLPFEDNSFTDSQATLKASEIASLPNLLDKKSQPNLNHLKTFLASLDDGSNRQNIKILFCAARPSQRENLLQQLAQIGCYPRPIEGWSAFLNAPEKLQITLAPIQQGFYLAAQGLMIIPESAILSSENQATSSEKETKPNNPQINVLQNLSELQSQDPVVHIDHGIGRYLGLEMLPLGEHQAEFIAIAYAKETKLYVPITDIHQISRYNGQSDPPLHTLNTDKWEKTKQKTLLQLRDTAADLLQLYAERAQEKGYAFNSPNQDYYDFSADFGFQETPDQKKAIEAVIADLCNEKPMDRLICGDVGFGKTEVAMRAAFIVAQSGKQVAILAPTTLLVDQHYRNFKDRFANWPITIDWLSRFRTQAENNQVQNKLKNGQIDIVIGTHALLSKTIQFKSLGLLIIDEEHHFGVQQKERLKTLKSSVDVLTLTATPIPRTLQTALSGLRELSIIATPPTGRLPIKNFITAREPGLIKDAILRELLRGGQIYFVHNRIATLEKVAREIAALVPEARIIVAHGQLAEHELEERMTLFYKQHYNILLCTSIIETGLDIPTANTLIVDRADHFGLAQLHQLRGRVGRSRHQAYAYFLIPHEEALTSQANKRLDALRSLTHLGAGFNLASYDLDIRGAGELLGEQQSGAIQGVGFSLYMELLEETIQSLKQGADPSLLLKPTKEPSIDLQIPTLLPQTYLPDVSIRLQYYKRIAKTKNTDSLQEIKLELMDKYGELPEPTQNLFAITELKREAQALGIEKLEATARGGWIELTETPTIDPLRIIQLIQKESRHFKLEKNRSNDKQRLRFIWESPVETSKRIEAIKEVFARLKQD